MPAPRETIESKPPSLEANLKHSDARTPESTRARAGSHDVPRRNGRDGPAPQLKLSAVGRDLRVVAALRRRGTDLDCPPPLLAHTKQAHHRPRPSSARKVSLLVKMYNLVRPYMLLLMAAAIATPPLPGIRGGTDQRRRIRNIFLYADAGFDLRARRISMSFVVSQV